MHGPSIKGVAPATPAVLVRLAASDYLAVARLAERDGNSLSGYVRQLVRRQIDASEAVAA